METKKPNYLHKFAPIFVIFAAIFWGILVVFVRAFGQADFKSMEIVYFESYECELIFREFFDLV